MPKDAASTRSNILAAAVQTLQRGGVEGFTLDAVARRAGVVKGLVLYHYVSRDRLLRAAASQIDASRSAALERALSSPGAPPAMPSWTAPPLPWRRACRSPMPATLTTRSGFPCLK
ncbi:MAG: hypothetical protein AUI09_00550 [Gemmatimonadetes bacterium 13_2_20CM_2_66_5]|nr:MAG: hypothetical protein AUI09_00550 [Gemmatimonadetes bacterium 13_2_20CM_2_66_5]